MQEGPNPTAGRQRKEIAIPFGDSQVVYNCRRVRVSRPVTMSTAQMTFERGMGCPKTAGGIS